MGHGYPWRWLGLTILLISAGAGFGCNRNYYYTDAAGSCPPLVEPPLLGVAKPGNVYVSEIPTQVDGGEVVADDPDRTSKSSGESERRTIISKPKDQDDEPQTIVSRGKSSRDRWQKPDPDYASGAEQLPGDETTIK